MNTPNNTDKTRHLNDPQNKIVNPQLAQAALNGVERFGDFKAFVKLNSAGSVPAGYRPLSNAAGFYAANIPCGEIEHLIADSNVLSVELREYITH